MKRVEEVWGTVVGLEVPDDADHAVFEDVFAWFRRVDALFSTWRDDSEIARLARGELALDQSSTETRIVLERCQELSLATAGAFDIAAASRLPRPHARGWCPLDPSAMVKGWALDRAREILCAAGATRFCLNAGGDVLVGSGPVPGEAWRIGVLHPWQRDRLAAVVAATHAGVATSGSYERGAHIVDPRSGSFAAGLASVTVVAGDLATADAYSTAIFALGRDGLAWLGDHRDVAAMAITDDGQVFTTEPFDRCYRVAP